MPDDTVRIKFEGNEEEARRVYVNSMREEWNQYMLEDGTVLRMRTILHDVYRLSHKFTPDGDPIYVVKTSNIVSPDVPAGLKRRTDGE